MDTMTVHRQRGIAEKQHRIGIDAGHPRYLRVRCIARRIVGSAGRVGRFAIDEILFFLDRQSVIRSEEHTSELQSLMRISYAVFCLKKKTKRMCLAATTCTQSAHRREPDATAQSIPARRAGPCA